MIQNEFITLSLQQFGQILIIPFTGQAVFRNKWDLGSLAYSQETEGPYHTDLPTPKEIHQFSQFQHVDPNRTIKNKNVILSSNQVLTKELRQDLKRWNELIYENVFRLGGHRDHLPACLAHILYCILAEQKYNLAYFFVKRIESARATPKAHYPYDKPVDLKVIVEKPVTPSLQLLPIITVDLHLTKEMMMRMMVLLVAPNAPLKTPSTKGTFSSSIDCIPKSPTSFTSPSTNSYLNSPTSPPPRVPPPPPTQENTSMDITLTLSPITSLDVQFNTPLPSPPIFGHPIP
uniref:Pentatricopeptide repeat-containing protein n=1 Tax=Tanacetum cinerariifolium TaxID=118510 RepID=A0A6L2LA57_TANCI|nr:pentatricopeptide repeat-containing protein [Tanacetum cinerariifolium]